MGKGEILIFKGKKLGKKINSLGSGKAGKILAGENGARIKTGTEKEKIFKGKKERNKKKAKKYSFEKGGFFETSWHGMI